MKHRRWNKFKANLGGYFWLPCPLCGKEFGGHEWLPSDNPYGPPCIPNPDQDHGGIGICPDCTMAGKVKEIVPIMFFVSLDDEV